MAAATNLLDYTYFDDLDQISFNVDALLRPGDRSPIQDGALQVVSEQELWTLPTNRFLQYRNHTSVNKGRKVFETVFQKWRDVALFLSGVLLPPNLVLNNVEAFDTMVEEWAKEPIEPQILAEEKTHAQQLVVGEEQPLVAFSPHLLGDTTEACLNKIHTLAHTHHFGVELKQTFLLFYEHVLEAIHDVEKHPVRTSYDNWLTAQVVVWKQRIQSTATSTRAARAAATTTTTTTHRKRPKRDEPEWPWKKNHGATAEWFFPIDTNVVVPTEPTRWLTLSDRPESEWMLNIDPVTYYQPQWILSPFRNRNNQLPFVQYTQPWSPWVTLFPSFPWQTALKPSEWLTTPIPSATSEEWWAGGVQTRLAITTPPTDLDRVRRQWATFSDTAGRPFLHTVADSVRTMIVTNNTIEPKLFAYASAQLWMTSFYQLLPHKPWDEGRRPYTLEPVGPNRVRIRTIADFEWSFVSVDIEFREAEMMHWARWSQLYTLLDSLFTPQWVTTPRPQIEGDPAALPPPAALQPILQWAQTVTKTQLDAATTTFTPTNAIPTYPPQADLHKQLQAQVDAWRLSEEEYIWTHIPRPGAPLHEQFDHFQFLAPTLAIRRFIGEMLHQPEALIDWISWARKALAPETTYTKKPTVQFVSRSPLYRNEPERWKHVRSSTTTTQSADVWMGTIYVEAWMKTHLTDRCPLPNVPTYLSLCLDRWLETHKDLAGSAPLPKPKGVGGGGAFQPTFRRPEEAFPLLLEATRWIQTDKDMVLAKTNQESSRWSDLPAWCKGKGYADNWYWMWPTIHQRCMEWCRRCGVPSELTEFAQTHYERDVARLHRRWKGIATVWAEGIVRQQPAVVEMVRCVSWVPWTQFRDFQQQHRWTVDDWVQWVTRGGESVERCLAPDLTLTAFVLGYRYQPRRLATPLPQLDVSTGLVTDYDLSPNELQSWAMMYNDIHTMELKFAQARRRLAGEEVHEAMKSYWSQIRPEGVEHASFLQQWLTHLMKEPVMSFRSWTCLHLDEPCVTSTMVDYEESLWRLAVYWARLATSWGYLSTLTLPPFPKDQVFGHLELVALENTTVETSVRSLLQSDTIWSVSSDHWIRFRSLQIFADAMFHSRTLETKLMEQVTPSLRQSLQSVFALAHVLILTHSWSSATKPKAPKAVAPPPPPKSLQSMLPDWWESSDTGSLWVLSTATKPVAVIRLGEGVVQLPSSVRVEKRNDTANDRTRLWTSKQWVPVWIPKWNVDGWIYLNRTARKPEWLPDWIRLHDLPNPLEVSEKPIYNSFYTLLKGTQPAALR